jgi:hypothetical protein
MSGALFLQRNSRDPRYCATAGQREPTWPWANALLVRAAAACFEKGRTDMSKHISDTNPSEPELVAEQELAQVQGGIDINSAIKLDLINLRQRLDLRGLTAVHVKDSGPSWVNSPRGFDLGQLVRPSLGVR